METIKMLIADNSFLIREGLKSAIKDIRNLVVAGEAQRAEDLSQKLLLTTPHVLVIDYSSAHFCLDDLLVISENFPQVHILAITSFQPKSVFAKALQNGATGHLLKNCGKEEIVEAIISTAKGQRYLCGKIADVLTTDILICSETISCNGIKLSAREIEIIQLIAEGMSNKQVADKLFISTHTVTTHRKNIMAKIGINNTASLVLFAIQKSLIAQPPSSN